MKKLDIDAIEARANAATPIHPCGVMQQIVELAAAYRDDVPAMVARIRELETATAWQPIETAPRDREEVLLWSASYPDTLIVGFHPGGKYGEEWESSETGETFIPTHWMPLPPAPEV